MLLMHNVGHWREQARRARGLGYSMAYPGARELMFEMAAGYERIAERAEYLVAAEQRWERRDATRGWGYPTKPKLLALTDEN